ncbi:NADP-dependent dehydrogenase [Thauera sp. 63]|nr:NADP-dependent dehydrogenase [Thauera sp. 63]
MPTEADWELFEAPLPHPDEGEVLARAIYLDVAPYMRGRISPQQNYAEGVVPGQLMVGGGVAEILESRHPDCRPGELIVTDFSFGWQEYATLRPASFRKIPGNFAPLPYWLDAFGINGLTAYFSLFEAARLKPGEQVAISAAAGSVGQIAGQLTKIAGAHGLAFTSSSEKARSCLESGYEQVINYRTEASLNAAVSACCPNGIDVFIDNTAGSIHDAVMCNLAPHARVIVVGTASLAENFEQPDLGARFLRQILVRRATLKGFLYLDYQSQHEKARERLIGWYESGSLRSRFDIAEGIESMPNAFIRLLRSENLGKQIVQVRSES